MTYSATSSTVTGKDGKAYALNQPLNGNAVQPSGGWKADIEVHGVPRTVTGRSGVAVFREAKRLLELNGAAFRELDLWLNLNIQWVQRVSDKHQVVTLSSLLSIAAEGEHIDPKLPPKPLHSKRQVPPKIWGAKGWGMLQAYLSQDIYEWPRFLVLAQELSVWVNPTVNPSIGCGECFIHYTQELEKLKASPAFEQDDARRWLVNTMNLVNARKGVTPMSYEKAKSVNYWS